MKQSIFIYPIIRLDNKTTINPYITDLIKSLSKNYNIVNKNESKRIEILQILKYNKKANYFYFNWIEDLPHRKFGTIRALIFIIILFWLKFNKKKILWVLHNKCSHNPKKIHRSKFMYKFMLIFSDIIITHSREGIEYIKNKENKYVNKVKYLPHPINQIFTYYKTTTYDYDFLIWGIIHPYKGVLEFLEYINKNNLSFKILIIGKCVDENYKYKINKLLNNNIKHIDSFYEINKISTFASKSKYILFTYKPETILSSGALMDSIRMGNVIIGPNIGAFKDLNLQNFVKTYESFDDIVTIYNNYTYDKEKIYSDIIKYYKQNNWSVFTDNMINILQE